GDAEGWFRALNPELAAADELRSYLLSHPVVISDDTEMKELLSGFPVSDLDDGDKVGSELLFSWISPSEYASRLAQVNILIAPFEIPFDLRCFLDEARQCYGFGQFAAVQSLCRTILEAAVNEIVVRTGRLSKE